MYISSELTIDKLWIWINDVTFAGNIAMFAGGAIFVKLSPIDQHLRVCNVTSFMIGLFTSTFIQNEAYFGGTAVHIRAPVDSKYNVFQMTIMSTVFHRNFYHDDILQRKYDCAVLYLSCV